MENGKNPRFEPMFELIPKTNWVRKYYDHFRERVPQSYPEYHFAGAMAFVQQSVGRKAYIAVSGRKHFSNLNHLLLGQTTTSNKTDAVMPIREWFIAKFPSKELPSEFSGAGLLEALEVNPCGYMIVDEAGTLFNRIKNNKEAGTIRDTLCKVYDNDPKIWKKLSSRGKGKDDGEICISDAFPCILLATTPDTFCSYSEALDITSGWMVRFLMYNPNYNKDALELDFNYVREDHDRQLMREYDTIVEFHKNQHSYKFIPSCEAKQFIKDWKLDCEEKYGHHKIHSAIYYRLMIMSLKIAMNMMLADIEELKSYQHGNIVELPQKYVDFSCDLIDTYFMPHAISVYESVERNSSKNIQDKIISKLHESGGDMVLWELNRVLHITARERDEHLHALFESHEVTLYKKDGVNRARFYQDGDDLRMAEQLRSNSEKCVKNARENFIRENS